MKKLFSIFTIAVFLLTSGLAMAAGPPGPAEFEGAGWYQKFDKKTGELLEGYKWKEKHPKKNSQWKLCEECGSNPEDIPGDYTAQANLLYSNIKSSHSLDISLWGHGNDEAEAMAEGGFTGEMTLFANGKYSARVGGLIPDGWCSPPAAFKGYTDADSFAHAWDFGTKSGAVAGADINGYVLGGGYAYGYKGFDEVATGSLTFGGYLQERTVAQEVGYANGSGIAASQFANIEFSETVQMDSYTVWLTKYVGGYLSESPNGVFGKSLVSIDNTGSHRSIEGSTFSKAYGPGETTVNMGGLVNGYISDGQSVAGGLASYSVINGGANNTVGQASLNATINNMGSSAGTVTVTVNASAGMELR